MPETRFSLAALEATAAKLPLLDLPHECQDRIYVRQPHHSRRFDPLERRRQRLEHLGDAFLYCTMTQLLYDRDDTWDQAVMNVRIFLLEMRHKLTRIKNARSMLISNVTLADFAIAWGFVPRMQPPLKLPLMGTSSHKPLADSFEVYLACVHEVHGFVGMQKWIKAAFSDAVDRAVKVQPKAAVPKGKRKYERVSELTEDTGKRFFTVSFRKLKLFHSASQLQVAPLQASP
jgi:dsRNA-specific ribonuclease